MHQLLVPAWFGGVFLLAVFLTTCWVFDGLPFVSIERLPPIQVTENQ